MLGRVEQALEERRHRGQVERRQLESCRVKEGVAGVHASVQHLPTKSIHFFVPVWSRSGSKSVAFVISNNYLSDLSNSRTDFNLKIPV